MDRSILRNRLFKEQALNYGAMRMYLHMVIIDQT